MSQVRVHDLSTDQIIDREMTAEELEVAQALAAESVANMAAATERAAAKAGLLDRLGITAEEAAILLG